MPWERFSAPDATAAPAKPWEKYPQPRAPIPNAPLGTLRPEDDAEFMAMSDAPVAVPERSWGELGSDVLTQVRTGFAEAIPAIVDAPRRIVNSAISDRVDVPEWAERFAVKGRQALGLPEVLPLDNLDDQISEALRIEKPQVQQEWEADVAGRIAGYRAATLSPTARAQGEVIQQADGVMGTLGALADNPSFIVPETGRMVGNLLPAMAGGLGLRAAGAGGGVATLGTLGGQGATFGNMTAQQVEQALMQADPAVTAPLIAAARERIPFLADAPDEAVLRVLADKRATDAFELSAVVNTVLPLVIPGGATVERFLSAVPTRIGSRVAGAGKGLVGESTTEALQGGSDQAIQNVATERPFFEDVGKSAALEAAIAGPLGGISGAASPPAAPNKKPPPVAPPADVPPDTSIDVAAMNALMAEPSPLGQAEDTSDLESLLGSLPPEVAQMAATITPEQAQAALGTILGDEADPDAPFRRPTPAPAATTPTPSPERASLPAQDFIQQAAAAMRMRSQQQAARTAAPAAQSPAVPAGSQPAGGDLAPAKQNAATTGDALTMQNRDRSRAAAVAQMQDIRKNPDADRLGFSRDPNTGAPMVGAGREVPAADVGRTDTVVMASGRRVPVRYAVVEADDVAASHDADGRANPGYDAAPLKALNNGRTAGLQAAYAGGNADAYRQGIAADEGLHGVSAAAIASKRNPVLVRLYDPAANTGDMGAESNASAQLGLSPVEQAQTDARGLPDLSGLRWAEDGSISPAGNSNFFRAWFANMGEAQAASLQDAQGRPNSAALQRVRAAMVHRAYGDERLLTAMAEEVNPDNRNVMNALVQAAPAFATLEHGGLTDDMREALVGGLETLRDASARGLSLADALGQGDLLGRSTHADTVARFMAKNARSAKRMAEAFKAMAEYAADAESQAATLDVFGNAPAADIGEAFNRAGIDNDTGSTASRVAEGRGGRESAQDERAATGDAFALQAEQPRAEAPREVAPSQGSGLFGAPTARDFVDARQRQRDDERDGKTGTGRTDMAAGDGELFAGRRPEQARVQDAEPDEALENVEPSQTDTPEFRRWFGDSKVVDANGKPLVVYHGTGRSFDAFDPGQRGAVTRANSARKLFFFTDSAEVASDYADYAGSVPVRDLVEKSERLERQNKWDEAAAVMAEAEALDANAARGQSVMPVYLAIQNPLRFDAEGQSWQDIQHEVNTVIAQAARRGHDGIIVENLVDDPGEIRQPSTHYGVFEPTQIKSATANRGTFDPDSPNILESAEAGIVTEAPQGSDLPEISRRMGEADAESLGLRAAVNEALGKVGEKVIFIRDTRGLPEHLRRGVERRLKQREGKGMTAALYDTVPNAQGGHDVYIITSVVRSPSRAVWNALHEIAGHEGLRKLLGDRLNHALEIALQNPTVRRVAEAIAAERKLDMGTERGRLLAAEEALAELAAAVRTGDYAEIETRYKVPVPEGIREPLTRAIDNFLKRLKAMVDDIFGRHQFTDEDVRALLENAWQAVNAPANGEFAPDLDGFDATTPDQTQTPEFRRWFGDSKVVDENGKPLVVYHGTSSSFDTFSDEHRGKSTGVPSAKQAFFFSGSLVNADEFGLLAARRIGGERSVMPVYLSIQNPLTHDVDKSDDSFSEVVDRAKAAGHDGVIFLNANDSPAPPTLFVDGEPQDVDSRGTFLGDTLPLYLDGDGFAGDVQRELADAATEAQEQFDDASPEDREHYQEEVRIWTFLRDAWKRNPASFEIKRGAGPATVYAAFRPEQIKSATGNRGNFDPANPSILESVEDADLLGQTPEGKTRAADKAKRNQSESRAQQRRNQAADSLGIERGERGEWDFPHDQWKSTDGLSGHLSVDKRGLHVNRNDRAALQDRMIAFRDAQRAIEKATGEPTPENSNVYVLENLMHGRVTELNERDEAKFYVPLAKAMAAADIDPDGKGGKLATLAGAKDMSELDAYLWARHAKERNADIAKKNPRMPDGGSGMTNATADKVLAAADKATMESLAGLVDAITSANRRRMLAQKLISQAQYDALEAEYEHFVPLRGKQDSDGSDVSTDLRGRGMRGLDSRQAPVKTAMGRGTGNAPRSITGEVIRDMMMTNVLGEKARVGRALLRMVLANPNPMWVVEKVKYVQAQDADGNVYERVMQDLNAPDVSVVRVGDDLYKVTLAPPLAKAFNHIGVDQLDKLTRAAGAVNRYFSAVFTKYNPYFILRNGVRDMVFGMTGLIAEHGELTALKAAMYYPIAARMAYLHAAGKLGTGKHADRYREYVETGGKTGWISMQSVEDLTRNLGGGVRGYNPQGIKKVARFLGEYVGNANDAIENALRFAAYTTLRDNGVSQQQAGYYAKELTVNFNRKGFEGQRIGSWILFFNPAMQGSKRFFELAKHPKALGYMTGLAGIQAIAMMAAMAGDDDDDSEPIANLIPEYLWRRNLVIVVDPVAARKALATTGFKDDNLAGVITIPMPYGVNVLTYAGGRVVRALMQQESRPEDTAAGVAADLALAAVEGIVPIPVGEGVFGLLHPLAGIFADITANRNFFGSPIHTGYADDTLPLAVQGKPDTAEAYKVIAASMNRAGGGDDVTPASFGWANVAPEDVEYVVEGLGGGPVRFITDMASFTGKWHDPNDTIDPRDVPALNSFVTNVDKIAAYQSLYYQRKDTIERAVERVNQAYAMGGMEAAQAALKAAPSLKGASIVRANATAEPEGKVRDAFDRGGLAAARAELRKHPELAGVSARPRGDKMALFGLGDAEERGKGKGDAKLTESGAVKLKVADYYSPFGRFKSASAAVEFRNRQIKDAYAKTPVTVGGLFSSEARERNEVIRNANREMSKAQAEFSESWNRYVTGVAE